MTAKRVLADKVRELEILTTASRMLNATLNLDDLLGLIMKIVKRALGAEAVSLCLVDESGEHLVFEFARGRRDGRVKGLEIPMGEGIVGWVARHKKPIVVNDVANERRYSLDLEKKLRLRPRSLLAVPLSRRGKLIGVLEAVNRKRRDGFDESDLSLALTLGEHIAISVANARLLRKAQRAGLEAKLLGRVGIELGKSLNLAEVLRRILDNLGRLVPFDAAAIFVVDRKRERAVSMVHRGYPDRAEDRLNVKIDEGVVSLAVKKRRGIIVDDVRANDRYIKARAATRSEIVAPMLSRGRLIGVFNLESDRVRAYDQDDLNLLQAFSAQVAVAIERAHLYEEQKEKAEIQKELRDARTIQEFFTPRRSRTIGGFRVAGFNRPSLEVSGDYYDFFPVKGGRLAFAVADVAGKGMPAALIVAGLRSTLHTVAPYLTSARQIALRANEILLESVRPQDFVTAFVGVLDPASGEVTYCNAGHNPPVLMRPDGGYRVLETGGPILGVFEDFPVVEGRFRFENDVLVCYSDGATEARNPLDEEYGEQRLRDAILATANETPAKICRNLFASLKSFVPDGERGDDVTYLVIKRKG